MGAALNVVRIAGNPARHISDDQHPEVPAWLCAGMPRHWYGAMRLKWAADGLDARQLEIKLYLFAGKQAVRHGWRVARDDVGKERLRRLCRLALYEMANPAMFSGAAAWRRRADFIGKGKSQWFAVWNARYEIIFGELNEWTNRAWRYMKVKRVKKNHDGA